MTTQYTHLWNLSRKSHLLDGISGLLGWDQETYMPKHAFSIRAQQRELLSELSHSIKTGEEFEKALSQLIDISTGKIHAPEELNARQQAALIAWRRDFIRLKKLPTTFVQNFTKLTSEAIYVWQEAKEQNNFSIFEPHLIQIVDQIRKKADLIGYTEHPYDALLDEYEPGCTTREIDTLFQTIKTEIIALLKSISQPVQPIDLQLSLTQEEQLQLCNFVLDTVHFDKMKGRLDISSHPFCSAAHPTDVRLTTRSESDCSLSPVLTTLHELGHGLYEMNLPVDQYGSPLGEAISLGIHESQSRFWETRIGRSVAFWQGFLPLLQKKFPHRLDHLTPEKIVASMNRVERSFIRVNADEVTYPLHVILRFEIEKALVEGTLSVRQLPEYWNHMMHEMLGIKPPTDSQGCLQDIHWSMGGIGYFPTYTLGNVFAAELFTLFEKDHPNWQDKIRAHDFSFINTWNNEHIHQFGRQYTSSQLIEKIIKRPVSSKAYTDYLKKQYSPSP